MEKEQEILKNTLKMYEKTKNEMIEKHLSSEKIDEEIKKIKNESNKKRKAFNFSDIVNNEKIHNRNFIIYMPNETSIKKEDVVSYECNLDKKILSLRIMENTSDIFSKINDLYKKRSFLLCSFQKGVKLSSDIKVDILTTKLDIIRSEYYKSPILIDIKRDRQAYSSNDILCYTLFLKFKNLKINRNETAKKENNH